LGNLLNANINSPEARAAGFLPPYAGFTGSVAQALRPYPQFVDIRNLLQPTGYSNYNSFQLRMQRRYANGASMLVAYTFSKTHVHGGGYTGWGDDASGARALDSANPRLEKRLAGFDIPHNFVLSWTYELPFGRGKKLLSSAPGVVNQLIGGWAINGIHRYVSGTPIGVGGGGTIPLFGAGNRPDRVPGVDPLASADRGSFDPARDSYLNLAAFAQPAPFTFGNAAPNYGDIRTFGSMNEDFSILKNFQIYEGHRLQFRTELFNAFNRVNFGGPSANINAPASFGRIGSTGQPRQIQFALKYIF
jgi:hypothetical protein